MVEDFKQEKQNYREHAKLHRDRIDIDETDFESIINIFLEFFKPRKEHLIAAYWPRGKEFDCRFLLDELVGQGCGCALPRVQKDSRILEFIKWTHDTPMKEAAFDIQEPQYGDVVKPDMVLAPLLAFDQKGYRLGYGGGYYDATIQALRKQKEITYIGVGYAEQAVLFKLPREAHDIPLDYMLTPQGVIDFKEG
jgi:5-formyltetrahydrofolate cyclo-ligase